jgi:hypothetical protein
MKLFWERKIGKLSVGKEENQSAKKQRRGIDFWFDNVT